MYQLTILSIPTNISRSEVIVMREYTRREIQRETEKKYSKANRSFHLQSSQSLSPFFGGSKSEKLDGNFSCFGETHAAPK